MATSVRMAGFGAPSGAKDSKVVWNQYLPAPLSRCMCAQSATLYLSVYPPVCLPVFVADHFSNNRSGTHKNHWHSKKDADEL